MKIFGILILLLAFGVDAQQESQFTNTVINPYLVNPAAGGLRDVAQIEILGRYQWVGYDGSAKSHFFTANTQLFRNGKGNQSYNPQGVGFQSLPLYSVAKTKHCVGFKAMTDDIGIFSKSGVGATYAYHLPLTKKINIGVGLGAGFSSFRIRGGESKVADQSDETYLNYLGGTNSQGFLDVQSGLVLYGAKSYLGISSSQVFRNKLEKITDQSALVRHIYINGNFRLIDKPNFALIPNFLVKMAAGSPVSADMGFQFNFQKSFWAGLTYRISNAAAVSLGINLPKNLYVAYGFELATGKLNRLNSSTHQIQIGIYIGHNRNVKKELETGKQKLDEIKTQED